MHTKTNRLTLERAEASLKRLRGESLAALAECGLSFSSPWNRVIEELPALERSTIQRLLRFIRRDVPAHEAIQSIPGPRAWAQIVNSVEERIGEMHPQAQRLRHAVDEFTSCLSQLGGTLSEARRCLDELRHQDIDPASQAQQSRAHWYEASADALGYSVDCLVDIKMMRETPGDPAHSDHVTLQSFNRVRATQGSPPFAIQYQADVNHPTREMGPKSQSVIISEGSSKPIPSILLLNEGGSSLGIIQNDWGERYPELSLSVLNYRPASVPVPWQDSDRCASLCVHNVHPTRRLVLDRIMTQGALRNAEIEFGSWRYRRGPSPGPVRIPWYDAIKEQAEVVHFKQALEAPAPEGCPDYPDILRAALDRIEWNSDDLLLFRAEVLFPAPLALYAMSFFY